MTELRAREALKKHGFRFNKSLGQNFLLDDGIIADIVDLTGIKTGDRVVEIGAGAGVLTARLTEIGADVVAIEIDKGLEAVLQEVLEGVSVRIIIADALKYDIAGIFPAERFHVVANLPYYITTDVIYNLTAIETLDSMTLLLQSEAASRVAADVGEEGYCALSAIVRLYGDAQILMDVPPGAFTPPPHVKSSLLRVNRRENSPYDAKTIKAMREVIRIAFAMRRKTLLNNLSQALRIPKADARAIVAASGLDENIRGEALDTQEISIVAKELLNRNFL